jgi:hypothetical protein
MPTARPILGLSWKLFALMMWSQHQSDPKWFKLPTELSSYNFKYTIMCELCPICVDDVGGQGLKGWSWLLTVEFWSTDWVDVCVVSQHFQGCACAQRAHRHTEWSPTTLALPQGPKMMSFWSFHFVVVENDVDLHVISHISPGDKCHQVCGPYFASQSSPHRHSQDASRGSYT